MSFVPFKSLVPADPINGFVLPGIDILFGAQQIDLSTAELQGEEICPLTMENLKSIDTAGVIVWAKKSRGSAEEKSIKWEYLCLSDEEDCSKGAGKLHVFDYDMLKGFIMSKGEYLKCPLCFRGAEKTEKRGQEDVEFIDNLLSKRSDCLNASVPDHQMALYWEKQIVDQFIAHLETESQHRDIVLEIIRNWSQQIAFTEIPSLMERLIAKDRKDLFAEIMKKRGNDFTNLEYLSSFMELACEFQASDIVEYLLSIRETPVTKDALQYLIVNQNEFLVELVLDHYSEFQKKARPEQLLSSKDWADLGIHCVVHETPFFISAVQSRQIYRLRNRLEMDPRVDPARLVALGIVREGDADVDLDDELKEWDDGGWNEGDDDWEEE